MCKYASLTYDIVINLSEFNTNKIKLNCDHTYSLEELKEFVWLETGCDVEDENDSFHCLKCKVKHSFIIINEKMADQTLKESALHLPSKVDDSD